MNTMNASEKLESYKSAAAEMVFSPEMKKAILSSHRITMRFRKIESWGEAYMEMECFKEVRDASGKTHDLSIGFFSSRGHFIGNGTGDALRTVPPSEGWSSYKVYSVEEDNWYRPERGFWGISHINQGTHERAVFKLLPVGSKLVFHVRLDYQTNPLMALAGLHGDVLELRARKGKQEYSVQLDTNINKHNSARFGFNY